MIVLWLLLGQIVAAWLCYVFAKFACKIQIQGFSFAFPVNLVVPVTVTVLISLCSVRESNVCTFNSVFPDYLFFKMPPMYNISHYIVHEYVWLWLLWLCAQAWITKHLWSPKNDRNAPTEKLFVNPLYCGLLVDQCVGMNRRKEDQENYVKKQVKQSF